MIPEKVEKPIDNIECYMGIKKGGKNILII